MFWDLLTRPRVKVISAMCSDFAVICVIGAFVAGELISLIANLLGATLSMLTAMEFERVLEESYYE